MLGIIEWLIGMEQLAGNVYRKAADTFPDDEEFSSFLSSLAEDEDDHFQLLKKARQEILQKMTNPRSAIIVDQNTKDQIKTPLQDLYEKIMAAHKVTEHAVMKVIINTEFSELNDIFLYIFSTLYRKDREIQKIFSTIHSHIDRIRDFFTKHSDERDLSDLIRRLTAIGKRRLLVVEDEMAIRTIIIHFLKEFGTIEAATNGQEALDKLKDSYFDVIISDIGMPVMDGLEFFQKAVQIDPDISENIIFCSGNVTPKIESFFKENHLAYLEKPFKLNHLLKTVRAIIYK